MQRTPRTAVQRRLDIGLMALAVFTVVAVIAALAWNSRPISSAEASSYSPPAMDVPGDDRESVAFLGDSYTVGSGASSKSNRWTRLVANERDWRELNFGVGGTNYATKSNLENGDPYVERVDEVVGANPDIVIVSSAGNSMDTDQQEAITETFEQLRAGLPDAEIIATSPYTRDWSYPDNLVEFGENIEAAVESVGGKYVEIGHPLEDHPEAMAEDGVHPNDRGYQLIATAIEETLQAD